MISDLSINARAGNISLPLSDSVSTVNEIKPQISNQGNNSLKSVQTIKELKAAELLGAPVSVGDEQWIKAVERVNKALQGIMISLEFSVHEKTHDTMVKVINKETGETIREIPSEKMVDMVAKMCELAGILIDKKA